MIRRCKKLVPYPTPYGTSRFLMVKNVCPREGYPINSKRIYYLSLSFPSKRGLLLLRAYPSTPPKSRRWLRNIISGTHSAEIFLEADVEIRFITINPTAIEIVRVMALNPPRAFDPNRPTDRLRQTRRGGRGLERNLFGSFNRFVNHRKPLSLGFSRKGLVCPERVAMDDMNE